MRLQLSILLTLFLVYALSSCGKVMPAGFWRSFQPDLLVEEVSDQGTYGGHRALYWRAAEKGTFAASQLIDFAQKNGWKLLDSTRFSATELTAWQYDETPIFPLSGEGFQAHFQTATSTYRYFPRWIKSNIQLFRFATDWIIVSPGTGDSHPAFGYVMVNEAQTEMAVYHLWGE